MGEKKGKALALELIDDLLNSDSGEVEIVQDDEPLARKKTPGPPAKAPEQHGTVVQRPGQAFKPAAPQPAAHEDNDKTIDINAAGAAVVPASPGEDRTVPINEKHSQMQTVVPGGRSAQESGEDRVRASVGRPGTFRSMGAPSATEAALAQSESLRIAQSRILELEQEIERLRVQNEELAAAGETLRKRADELLADNTRRDSDYQYAVSTFEQEKGILTTGKETLQRENEALKRKNDELELRISTNIQKIRVRERELENRLELVKMEGAALIRAKDEMILDLKRQIDQLNLELTNYRSKNQELNRQTNDKQEMLRRTVKALRLALSMLEGEEEAPKGGGQRKAK